MSSNGTPYNFLNSVAKEAGSNCMSGMKECSGNLCMPEGTECSMTSFKMFNQTYKSELPINTMLISLN